jgi:methyl-accepting chemotaxis protein
MDGTIITANDNFLAALGYSLEEFQGKHHNMFVEPSFKASQEYKIFWERLNQGELESKEYKRIGKAGKEFWIQASYNPIFDLNGTPFKVVKYASDITGNKSSIEKIKDTLMAMSNDDLPHKIEGDLFGEFNIIGESINLLIENLSSMVGEIRSTSTSVYDSARELAMGNSELSERTETQASSLEETASAIEELTSTAQQNSKNSATVSKLSNAVMNKAKSGGGVVKNAIAAMSDINRSSKKLLTLLASLMKSHFKLIH